MRRRTRTRPTDSAASSADNRESTRPTPTTNQLLHHYYLARTTKRNTARTIATSVLPRFRPCRLAAIIVALGTFGLLIDTGPAGAATATTVKPATQPANASRAFCGQVASSQTKIGAATATAKLTVTAAEWVKIEATAPSAIKPSVTIVRTAYQAAAKAGTAPATKTTAVSAAGTKITAYVTANCSGGAGRGPVGGDNAAMRACLTKAGISLPTGGVGAPRAGGSVPAAGGSVRPAGGSAIRPTGGSRPTMDAATQKAMEACRAATQTVTTTK
jgi:hypothetical protein